MGYRSDVAIKCQSKAFEKFKEAYEGYDELFHPDRIYVNYDNTEYLLVWDWVKWYGDYSYVQAIENVMCELDKIDEAEAYEQGMAYRYLRLGEDDEDVEKRCNNYDLELYYIRKIDVNGLKEVI